MFATFAPVGGSVKVDPLWTPMNARSAVENETRLMAVRRVPAGSVRLKYSRSPNFEVAMIEFVPTVGKSSVGARRSFERSPSDASSCRTTAPEGDASSSRNAKVPRMAYRMVILRTPLRPHPRSSRVGAGWEKKTLCDLERLLNAAGSPVRRNRSLLRHRRCKIRSRRGTMVRTDGVFASRCWAQRKWKNVSSVSQVFLRSAKRPLGAPRSRRLPHLDAPQAPPYARGSPPAAGPNGRSRMPELAPTAPIKHPDRFFIDGGWAAPSSAAKIEVINSATEEVFSRVAEAQEADIHRAVAAARQAFDRGPWPRMRHAERAKYLRAIAREIERRADDLAQIWTTESGIIHLASKPSAYALGGVYDYYAGLADTFPFEEQRQPGPGSGNVGLLVREPVGVVAAIIPWNGPAMLIAYKCAPALLAGCTVILKCSPEAPGAGYILGEICEQIGLPPGVVNVLTADREVSERLVRHPGVDKVTFTGSTAAGRRIASICGERIARCTLELGGKSAAVILDDYDVGKAALTISGMAGFLTGQVCSSLTRIVVTKKRHDALVDALSASFSRVPVGDPFDPGTGMGPLAMRRQRDRVEGYIAKGKAEGARLATGGGRPKHLDRGFYIEPTVFGNVDNHSTIAREEIFGPVLSVIAAESESNAVDIANDSIYGLNASVFTNDVERAYATARELRSGTVGHNSFRTDFNIAFGGFKQSGLGREGGTEGLHPFLETKTLILDAKPAHVK